MLEGNGKEKSAAQQLEQQTFDILVWVKNCFIFHGDKLEVEHGLLVVR